MYKHASRFYQSLRQRGQKLQHHTRSGLTQFDYFRHRLIDEPEPQKLVKQPPSRVYVVLFWHKRDEDVRFIKIGVSAASIDLRFKADGKYRVSLIVESRYLDRKDAMALEASLHEFLANQRVRPKFPLKTGNGECYIYSDENLRKIRNLVNDMGA